MKTRAETFAWNVKNQLGKVHRVASLEKVPALVRRLAEQLGLEPKAVVAAASDLKDINWKGLEVEHRPAEIEDVLGISRAMAGIAETGTLVFASGKSNPPSLNFIPEYSIAIVRESELVDTSEEVWAILRKKQPFPATINMVTGPSKTGDIEQTLFLGAHGPRELHVVMVKS